MKLNNKFQNILISFRDKVLNIFDNFQEIMQIRKGMWKVYFNYYRNQFEWK